MAADWKKWTLEQQLAMVMSERAACDRAPLLDYKSSSSSADQYHLADPSQSDLLFGSNAAKTETETDTYAREALFIFLSLR